MAEVAIIINVSEAKLEVPLGARGAFVVPGRGESEFGLLVVREVGEIRDIGSGQKIRTEAIKASETANDILNYGDDMRKRGLLICAAQPDEPPELLKAERNEREYLNTHKPRIEYEKDEKGMQVAVNKQEDRAGAVEEKTKLSNAVVKARASFERECRKLVTREEIAQAKRNMLAEDQRLVAQGDALYARENTRQEITEKHQNACRRLGQERPWCYTPGELEDCGACGQKVKKGIAICGHCGAVLDDAKARQFKVGPYRPELEAAAAGAKGR